MMFLYEHLESGSFRNIYCDTDSMCLALSKSNPDYENNMESYIRSIFDLIVKPEMKSSWEENLQTWFVTSSDVRNQKQPGLMKKKYKLYSIL